MKFKLCALAATLAAGLVSAAQAQTTVTLYGVVDLGIGYEKVEGPNGFEQSRVGMIDGGHGSSRFGLKGAEDLGGGLKAIFTLENGYNASTGKQGQSGRLFGRQATLGLQSDSWGKIQAGLNKNFQTSWVGEAVSPFGTNFGSASIGSTFSGAASVRYDNLVTYETPKFGGFQAGVGYSFNADSGKTNTGFATDLNNRATTLGLRYSAGPVYLAAAYDSVNLSNQNSRDEDEIQSFMLGGTYDFEVVKIGLAYGQVRDGWMKNTDIGVGPSGARYAGSYTAAKGFRANSYLVAATVPLGANKVFASWQAADPKNDKLNGQDETTNVYSIGFTHDLSKRTNVYAYAAYADNFYFREDVKSTSVAVGLRHRF